MQPVPYGTGCILPHESGCVLCAVRTCNSADAVTAPHNDQLVRIVTMPNWCASELSVEEGTETDITAFVDGFRAAFASPGNYETVSAMIHCDEDGARHVAAVQTPFACTANEFSVTPDGKQRINCLFEPEYDVSDNRAVIQFTSRWTPPWDQADLVRMSAAFPALTIMFRFAEQGMGFVGAYTMQYGAV